MDNLFRSKWFVRIISLVFAVLLYVFVVDAGGFDIAQKDPRYTPSGEDETEIVDDMPVTIQIDDDKYVVSGVPKSVSVSLEGSAGVLRPTAIQKNFEVFVDLKRLKEGEHTVDIDHGDLPQGLKAYIEPKTIDVTIEERATETYTVQADFINEEQLSSGYDLGEYTMDPEEVKITSSQSVIDQIALVKVFVDVKGIKEPINKREVPVNVYDNEGNELDVKIEPQNVLVSVDIHNPDKVVKVEVPTKGELPKGLEMSEFEPDRTEVEVYAKKERLTDLETLKTEPVDLSKITKSGKLEAKIDLPDEVEVKNDGIIVDVKLKQTKTVKDVPVKLINKATRKKIQIKENSNDSIELEVSGPEDIIADLKSDDFKVTANAGGLADGEHQIPIRVNGPSGVTVKHKDTDVTLDVS